MGTVQIKRSSTAAAAPSSLLAGELALNIPDEKLYYKNASVIKNVNLASLAAMTTFGASLLSSANASAARSTLELVKQTSSVDSTSGRVLLTGAFGLGANAILLDSGDDLNDITENGFYCWSDSAPANAPDTFCMMYHNQRSDSSSRSQVVVASASERSGQIHSRGYTGGAWQAFRLSFDQKNILGTVSQSSGVPTGAVIERGSNANGRYVKFADGTLICTAKVNFDHNGAFSTTDRLSYDWTFPATFASGGPDAITMDVPVHASAQFTGITGANSGRSSVKNWGTSASTSTTTAGFSIFFDAGTVSTTTGEIAGIRLMAIGRWF